MILHPSNQKDIMICAKICQNLIYWKQNPPDCESSNRLTCKPQQTGCGFGCQFHWMLYCFTISHGLGRTFVPHSSFLQNYDEQGWNSVLLPLSENCQHLNMRGRNFLFSYWVNNFFFHLVKNKNINYKFVKSLVFISDLSRFYC